MIFFEKDSYLKDHLLKADTVILCLMFYHEPVFFIFGQAQCCSNEIFHWAGMAAMITNIFSQWLYADNTEICVCFGARLHSAPMGLRIILEFVRVDTLKPSGQLYSIFQEWCPYADKVEAFGRPAFFR